MKILITGATGFVGNKLGLELTKQGHQVVALVRSKESARSKLSYPCELIEWSAEQGEIISNDSLLNVEVVFNLVGAGIADERWSDQRKKTLYDSRVTATEGLVKSLEKTATLKTFISFSAIGYYGDRENERLTEKSPKGQGFLPELCEAWEKAAQNIKIKHPSVRLITPRLGVVISENEGFLKRLEPIFRSKLGGRLGSGNQYVSWIHIDDLISFLVKAIDDEGVSSVYNLCAPNPVTNKILTENLADALQVGLLAPVPAFALKLLYGEMSQVLLESQNAVSEKIPDSEFKFKTLDEALSDVYKGLNKNEARFTQDLWVPLSQKEAWEFFSTEKNLEEITPPLLQFHFEKMSTDKIKKGTLIDYRLKIHGVPVKWKTLISEWHPPKLFIDEQLSGPYKKWHHVHELIEFQGGTLLRDRVTYKLPFEKLGRVAASAFVASDVERIFKYRSEVIARRFHS